MAPSFGIMARLATLRRIWLGGFVGFACLIRLEAAAPGTNSTHWAFQPLKRVEGKARGVDDFFPQPLPSEADRRTLIRRLSFDLRGLTPSMEEVEEFVKEARSGAYERLVERFLGSQQYGERWGRHWLDLVGYADSNGYFSADSDRPLAWKYRDYVVRSINSDKPLDLFITEQIAGDELVGYIAGGDVTPEMVEPLIATHFWRNAPDGTMESDGNPLEVKVDKYAVIEGNVQILGSAFLGLTLQCARCHDHKFEPVTQEEYYRLQAILRPAFDVDHWLKPDKRVIEVGTREEREAHKKRVAEVERDLKTFKESLEGLTAPFRKQVIEENLAPVDTALRKSIQKALDTKEKERSEAMKSLLKTNAALVEVSDEALQKRFPVFAAAAEPIRQAMKKRESERPAPLEQIAATYETTNALPVHHLLVRGNHANEGQVVEPGPPKVFGGPKSKVQSRKSSDGAGLERDRSPVAARRNGGGLASSDGDPGDVAAASADLPSSDSGKAGRPRSSGRRLELARWLTSPENPILARALVNRVWHYHFGKGLVATVENLGQSGSRPLNPELLDWLAGELVRSGWSLKHVHRLILNSATWKEACGSVISRSVIIESALNTESLITDSLFHRLDAESLRDAMLAVSGELDLTLGGPYVPTKTDGQGQVVIAETQAGAHRRSIYLQQRRTSPVNFISTFDGPAHNPVCVQRVTSTVALQSLSLLNSDFVRARAKAFAKRVMKRAGVLNVETTEKIASSPLPSPPSDGGEGESSSAVRKTNAVVVASNNGEKERLPLPDPLLPRREEREKDALRLAFELAYSRPPTAVEFSAAQAFLREQRAVYAEKPDATEKVWADLCQMLLASNAFLYVD